VEEITCARTIRAALDGNDKEAVMSKLECEIVSIAGDHKRISLGSAEPIAFGLSVHEIKHRIIQAYMRLVFRADKAPGPRTVSVTRSGLIEAEMTEMPPDVLAPGLPLFMLEVFSLPNHSSVDSYGFIGLDDAELVAATEFVLGAAREAESINASALHEAASTERCGLQ
jgi:hypothetical protein